MIKYIDEVDEGFVDNSTAAPSISEHMLTVDAGAPEEDDCEDNEEIEDEDEASAVHTWTTFM